MTPERKLLDGWLSAVLAVGLLVAAAWYAAASRSAASRQISQMHFVADSLSRTAEGAVRIVNNRGQIQRLESRRDELEMLMADSQKQGLIPPQLSEAARSQGLSVIEILPVIQQGDAAARSMPRYRVMVQGDFRAIAAYMQGCLSLRIPTRVVAFDIRSAASAGNTSDVSGRLRATITIEAFMDLGSAAKEDSSA